MKDLIVLRDITVNRKLLKPNDLIEDPDKYKTIDWERLIAKGVVAEFDPDAAKKAVEKEELTSIITPEEARKVIEDRKKVEATTKEGKKKQADWPRSGPPPYNFDPSFISEQSLENINLKTVELIADAGEDASEFDGFDDIDEAIENLCKDFE